MKTNIITIIITLVVSFQINAQQLNQEIAKESEAAYLLGKIDKSGLEGENYTSWFTKNYEDYPTNQMLVDEIASELKTYSITLFMGTWCGDSKRGVPRFYKILEETGFDQSYFELVTVGRNKKTPDNLQERFDLLRVPTFIFLKDGKEVGRYVERPRETMEKDILKIITGEPYKHSYDKSE